MKISRKYCTCDAFSKSNIEMPPGKEKFRSWIPHGFDFLTPEESEKITDLSAHIRKELKDSGYREIIPPMFDFYQTFQITTRQAASLSDNPVFEVKDSTGEVLAVRSDLTVQAVKAAASGRLGREFPMNLFYIQSVFHDKDWGAGRKREILQAGVEIIGEKKNGRFSEILELAKKIITAHTSAPSILYGDVRFINILFKDIHSDYRLELAEAFYRKDTSLIKGIAKKSGADKKSQELLCEVPLIFGKKEAIAELKKLTGGHPGLLILLEEAEKIENVIYDFSLVRELSYYTGPVFEAYISPAREAVLTGGVYDNLFGEFSDHAKTACGFAMNLTVLSQYI